MGDYAFVQDDATTANCLVNLHFTQDDACISLASSECAANAGTSKILKVRASDQGNDGAENGLSKLTNDDSNAIQAAISTMVRNNVNSYSNMGVLIDRFDFTKKKSSDTPGVGDQPTLHGGVAIFSGGLSQC